MEHGDDYKAVNAIGEKIAAFRNNDESALVVSFGSTDGGQNGFVTVGVQKSGFTATSEALRIGDAVMLARGKVNRMIEADKAKREKKKRDAS